MRFNPWIALALAAATLLALGVLGLQTQDYGFALMLGVPFVAGLVLGRWLRPRGVLQVVCGLSLAAGAILAAIAANLAGLLCGVIAGLIFGGPLVLGVAIGSRLKQDGGGGRVFACVGAVAILLPVEGSLGVPPGLEEVVTEAEVPLGADEAFLRFQFYEALPESGDPLLSWVLPKPVGSAPVDRDGRLVRCDYETGHLLKQVTRSEPGRLYAFDVVEQVGVEEHSARLVRGRVEYLELSPRRTRVRMTTVYRPLLSARPVWRPFETSVVRALHRHVLRGIR